MSAKTINVKEVWWTDFIDLGNKIQIRALREGGKSVMNIYIPFDNFLYIVDSISNQIESRKMRIEDIHRRFDMATKTGD